MEFKRGISSQSAEGCVADMIEMIHDEIEILEATLAPYEFSCKIDD